MSKAKKTVIVEYLYTGLFEFSNRGKWIKWRAYRDLKTAENVAELLNRKFGKSFQFRVQPPNTASSGLAPSAQSESQVVSGASR